MGFDEARWVWMNGTIVPWSGATLHVSAHTLHYGSGVFEGIRCYETIDGPAIFRLREHLQRLVDSARFYDMEIPYTAEELEDGICELTQLNDSVIATSARFAIAAAALCISIRVRARSKLWSSRGPGIPSLIPAKRKRECEFVSHHGGNLIRKWCLPPQRLAASTLTRSWPSKMLSAEAMMKPCCLTQMNASRKAPERISSLFGAAGSSRMTRGIRFFSGSHVTRLLKSRTIWASR